MRATNLFTDYLKNLEWHLDLAEKPFTGDRMHHVRDDLNDISEAIETLTHPNDALTAAYCELKESAITRAEHIDNPATKPAVELAIYHFRQASNEAEANGQAIALRQV